MVPYEAYAPLRTHLAHQFTTSSLLRQVANDYYNLARTRMRDLEGRLIFLIFVNTVISTKNGFFFSSETIEIRAIDICTFKIETIEIRIDS